MGLSQTEPRTPPPTIGRGVAIGYASGNLGKSLFWTSLEYILLFYMTDVVGIAPYWAGIIIVTSLIWDGITDPLMGYWVDRRSSGGHDYRPYLRWGPPLCGVAFTAIFWTPFASEGAMALYLLVANLLFRSAYTLLDVPHNALLAQLPSDPHLRTRISAWRYFFSSVGGLSVALAIVPMLNQRGGRGGEETQSFILFASIASVAACLAIWPSLRLARVVAEGRREARPTRPPFTLIRDLIRSPFAVRFFLLAAMNALTLPLFARMAPYVAKYSLGTTDVAGAMFIAFTMGQIIAMPTWTALANQWGKRRCFLLAYLVLAATLVFCALGGLSAVSPMITACLAGGFAIGAVNMLIWALAPEVVDRMEQDDHARPDAMFMSLLTFTQKSAIGIGSLVAGSVLGATGFVADQAQHSLALNGIALLAFGLPMIGAIVGFVLLTSKAAKAEF